MNLESKNETTGTTSDCDKAVVSSIFFDDYAKPEIEDLKKVLEAREIILDLINSTNLHECIIECLQKPFDDLLEYNGVNLSEQDF